MDLEPIKKAFTEEEKQLLLDLLKTEPIMKDKRTNKATNKMKSDAWLRITNAYNSHGFVYRRTPAQLKRCWEKIKVTRARALRRFGGVDSSPNIHNTPDAEEDYPHSMDQTQEVFDSDSKYELEVTQQRTLNMDPLSPDTSSSAPTLDPENHLQPVASRRVELREARAPRLHTRGSRRGLNPRVLTMREKSMMEERKQQQELHTLRCSILDLKRKQEVEKLRSLKRKHQIEETLAEERLMQQRSASDMKTEDTGSVHFDASDST